MTLILVYDTQSKTALLSLLTRVGFLAIILLQGTLDLVRSFYLITPVTIMLPEEFSKAQMSLGTKSRFVSDLLFERGHVMYWVFYLGFWFKNVLKQKMRTIPLTTNAPKTTRVIKTL